MGEHKVIFCEGENCGERIFRKYYNIEGKKLCRTCVEKLAVRIDGKKPDPAIAELLSKE